MRECAPPSQKIARRLVVVGAGPAGLTAAYEACQQGFNVTVLEASDRVGGLAQTVVHEGNAFDVGGHRFFTKYPQVESWWRDILGPDLITVRRRSRIYYRSKFFDYPLRAGNALTQLGLGASALILGSYVWARVHPRRPERTFADWVSNRFGRRLYTMFFKSYTEKLWGIPCRELSANWATQRIKSLSLGKAIADALGLANKGIVTTLIDQFLYPRLGPGMLWERVAKKIQENGGHVVMENRVEEISVNTTAAFTLQTRSPNGSRQTFTADAVISSAPLSDLVLSLRPPAPATVQTAARALAYRDFISVMLVVSRANIFPDNWIYLHDPTVKACRLQNYGNWSPAMVATPGMSCLGLEYFCNRGDDLWRTSDADLVDLAQRELHWLGFASSTEVTNGWVTRMPRAYPTYRGDYQQHIHTIAIYLKHIPSLFTVGRNGMHRYNNQDHSMLTAMLAVENLCGANHDLWSVNVDDEYHETKIMPSLHSTSSR